MMIINPYHAEPGYIITMGLDPSTTVGNHEHIGFLSNNGSDPPENHKTTKPAFNVEPLWARQRNVICWLTVVSRSFLSSASTKKKTTTKKTRKKKPINVKVGPPPTKLSGFAHVNSVDQDHLIRIYTLSALLV